MLETAKAGKPRALLPPEQVSQALILGCFVCLMPLALLFVLAGSPALGHGWISPEFRVFLLCASAVLSFLIGYWLHAEVRLSAHPAAEVLSSSFLCHGLLLGASAWLSWPAAIAWSSVATTLWPVVFSAASLAFLRFPRLRNWGRRSLQTRPRLLPILTGGGFLLVTAAMLLYAQTDFFQTGEARHLSGAMGFPALAGIAAVVVFTFDSYLERRLPVLLSFTLSLFLLGLATLSRMIAEPWQLLWWYALNLHFVSLFLAAYGILEGHRVREREALIAELGALSRRLEQQSVRDPLTGCFNRRFMEEALDNEFRKSFRTQTPLSLLAIDADNFKTINDTYGHPCGDAVLCELSLRMRSVLRASDVLARYGGEEFFVLLPSTNRAGGQEVATKILNSIRGHSFQVENQPVRLTVSVGIADSITPGVSDAASLIAASDRALYAAKRAGRNRAACIDPLSFQVPAIT